MLTFDEPGSNSDGLEETRLEPSQDGYEKSRPGPSQGGREERWKCSTFSPDLVQFEAEDERGHEQEDWQPLDYVEQHMDTELIKLIADCMNVMSLSDHGKSLNTSVDEIHHVLVPYP